ncbi:MAG TPA: hypothetical protein VMN58_04720 [Acidimicrobiales bacterium]|nr:hypothetical protein [Acidimicrobiales bacterium]
MVDIRPAAAEADPRPPTRNDAPSHRPTRAEGGLLLAAIALAVLPVVVATVRAASRGWLPVGDNAYFAIRARDVLTEHHPLLGTWTSASVSAGTDFNNPGPLLFDLLAVPAKLGDEVGVAVGAALLNCLALVLIAVMARRRGGVATAALATLVAVTLAWSMGSELLFDPWQPHSLLLTFLLVLVLVWSLACGDVVALPLAVGAGSLILQTHLSYAVLLAALGLWGAVGLALALRRQRRLDEEAWAGTRRQVVRMGGVAVLVLVLAWSQPLIEQLTSDGQGNLARLAGNAGDSAETIGPQLGTQVVAGVVAAPPWWLRPSFGQTLQPAADGALGPGYDVRLPDLPGTTAAIALLALLSLFLALAGWWGRRQHDRATWTAAITAGVALAAGLVTAWSLPVSFLGIAPHQFRWLWPVAAFATLALALVAQRTLEGRGPRLGLPVVLVVLVAVMSALTLPTSNTDAGPAADAWAIPVVHRLNDGMAALEGEGPLVIDLRGIRFAEPYSGPVMAELQRRGIAFLVDDEGMERQMGPSRRLRDQEAQRLLIREGDDAAAVLPGARRVVLVEGLDRDARRELDALRSAVESHLATLDVVRLDDRGLTVQAAGRLPVPLPADPEILVGSRLLLELVEDDLLSHDDPWHDRFARYAELQRRWDRQTVGLFLAPLDWEPS